MVISVFFGTFISHWLRVVCPTVSYTHLDVYKRQNQHLLKFVALLPASDTLITFCLIYFDLHSIFRSCFHQFFYSVSRASSFFFSSTRTSAYSMVLMFLSPMMKSPIPSNVCFYNHSPYTERDVCSTLDGWLFPPLHCLTLRGPGAHSHFVPTRGSGLTFCFSSRVIICLLYTSRCV